jgi:hypothetical protein
VDITQQISNGEISFTRQKRGFGSHVTGADARYLAAENVISVHNRVCESTMPVVLTGVAEET